MASKAELEAEVERLRTELSDKTVSPEQIDEDVTSLKEELDRIVDERDALRLACTSLNTELDTVKRDLQVARDSLELKTKAPSEEVPSDDCVILGGQKYPIIWKSSVKGLAYEGYQMRRVEEFLTALVIKKDY